jgi:hypothetical protein
MDPPNNSGSPPIERSRRDALSDAPFLNDSPNTKKRLSSTRSDSPETFDSLDTSDTGSSDSTEDSLKSYKEMIEQFPVGISIYYLPNPEDPLSLTLEYVNPAAETFL